MLGEDVEDQRGPVDDLDLDDVLQRAALGGREVAVDHDGVRPGRAHELGELGGLAGAEVGARVRVPAALEQPVEHDGPGRLGERGELAQGDLGVLGGALAPDADEDDALEAQLPVLDLGDVLELGGQPGDTAQRRALLEVELVAVVGGVAGGTGGDRGARPGQDTRDDVAGDVLRAAGLGRLRDVVAGAVLGAAGRVRVSDVGMGHRGSSSFSRSTSSVTRAPTGRDENSPSA